MQRNTRFMNKDILGNINRQALLELLVQNLGEKRTKHVLAVEAKTLELCKIYNVDKTKGRTAALYHDFAKKYTIEKSIEILIHYGYDFDALEAQSMDLLHSKVAGILAQYQYDVNDNSVIEAILYHTTGKANMNLLSKIIFVADAIEETRDYPNVNKYREIAKVNIDEALLEILNGQIIFLVNRGKKIHPDTIQARNFLLG